MKVKCINNIGEEKFLELDKIYNVEINDNWKTLYYISGKGFFDKKGFVAMNETDDTANTNNLSYSKQLTSKQVYNLFGSFFDCEPMLKSVLSQMRMRNVSDSIIIPAPLNTRLEIIRKGCIFYFYLLTSSNKIEANVLEFTNV